ncbi:MAG: methyltransferase domain-containing protein [Xanthomonadaceae bacterium]|nr:methyltransferase domain-containing protein [Rhodospirillaceae bacterium]NIA18041.1 methyltransferase domain-containing protein [Xanthomonadaceae bacterium]
MHYYFFILGQNKNLSIAELLNKEEINLSNLSSDKIKISNKALFLKLDIKLDFNKFLDGLGGFIKIGEIKKEFKDLRQIKPKNVLPFINKTTGKIKFGFSFEGKIKKEFIKNLSFQIKRILRSEKINSRWIEAKGDSLSSVVVGKNNLIKKGAEIYIFEINKKFYLGKTLAIQNFEKYSYRDFNRPARDIISGTMPPKLAQIMINLANRNKSDIILDPFCGSGTILQEALLMNFQNIIGSDLSEKAINDSKKNLEWLKNNFQFSIFNFQLIKIDVRSLSKKIKANSIDAIITEPYLGPTTKIANYELRIANLISELSQLYLNAFKEFKKILKKNGRIVIIFPALKDKKNNKLIYLDILDQIKLLGFKIVPFLPNDFSSLIETTDRGSIIYARSTSNQRIAREIFIFEKR